MHQRLTHPIPTAVGTTLVGPLSSLRGKRARKLKSKQMKKLKPDRNREDKKAVVLCDSPLERGVGCVIGV